jgi:hypothetical protein
VVTVTPRPHSTPGKDPVPIVQETGWAQGRCGQVRKISPPAIRSPDLPARSQLLYRLSYPTHYFSIQSLSLFQHTFHICEPVTLCPSKSTIYPLQRFPFCWAFVCEAGKVCTRLRILQNRFLFQFCVLSIQSTGHPNRLHFPAQP